MTSRGYAVLGIAAALCLDGCSEKSPPPTGNDTAPLPDAPAAVVPPDAARDANCAGWTTLARVPPAEAKALIETVDPIVINVHVPFEGDIPGTDASIPYNDVDAIEAYLGHDPCADVLLVCRSGAMSQSAGNELVRRGYLRIRDLSGGFVAWQAAGYPLLTDGGR